jgi:hypothetical protein
MPEMQEAGDFTPGKDCGDKGRQRGLAEVVICAGVKNRKPKATSQSFIFKEAECQLQDSTKSWVGLKEKTSRRKWS